MSKTSTNERKIKIIKKLFFLLVSTSLLNGCAFINDMRDVSCLKTIMKSSTKFGYEKITVGLNRYDALPEDLAQHPYARRADLSIAVWKNANDVFHYIGYTIVEKNGKRDDVNDVFNEDFRLLEYGSVYTDIGVPYELLLNLLNENKVDYIIIKFVEGDVILKNG